MPAAANPSELAKRRARIAAWRRMQTRILDEASLSIVCSTDDERRLGMRTDVAVVPNSYPVPELSVSTPSAEQPVFLFPGSFLYGPNAQGARWLADDIAPILRERLPNARLRLAGKAGPAIEELGVKGLEVAGFVPSMADELRQASCVIVPLLAGSGTRIKILEAFAHRIPVVTTSIGCEGLDIDDGVHAVVADTPAAFADACEHVIAERGLGTSLADAAHSHFRRRFSREVVMSRIAALAHTIPQNAQHDNLESNA